MKGFSGIRNANGTVSKRADARLAYCTLRAMDTMSIAALDYMPAILTIA